MRVKKRPILLIIFSLFILTILCQFFYIQFLNFERKKENLTATEIFYKELPIALKSMEYQIVNYEPRGDTKHVLFFTGFWHWTYWGMSAETMGKDSYELSKCKWKNCIFTHKRDYLKHIHEYDAVIFHQSVWIWHNKALMKPIGTRSPHQHYIVAAQESAEHVPFDYFKNPDFFNLTMTYRLDSDIWWHFGEIRDIGSNNKVSPGYNIKWRTVDEDYEDQEIENLVKNKTGFALWTATECKRPSRREVLVKKLQEYFPVDIGGACGNYSCIAVYPKPCTNYSKSHLFYLALENTLCMDYLTEKVFIAMNDFIIPVVYSGADLQRFLPPKSYIDANLFKTAEDLAKYLKFLAENVKEYVKYFWWKKYYKVFVKDPPPDICAVCTKLNEPNLDTKKHVYEDINKWFNDDKCSKPKIYF